MAAGRGQMGRGNATQPIYLDEVTCFGNEPNVTLCHHADYGVTDCSHFEDAGVVCDGRSWCDGAVGHGVMVGHGVHMVYVHLYVVCICGVCVCVCFFVCSACMYTGICI